MSEKHAKTEMYYLQIGQCENQVFAKYVGVFKKESSRDVSEEVRDLIKGETDGWCTCATANTGDMPELDINFENSEPKALIFQIINPKYGDDLTNFRKRRPLETMRVRGMRNADIIGQTKTYKDDVNYRGSRIWATALVNPKQCREDILDDHSNADSGLHGPNRFPFFFNFFDYSRGISPVLLDTHNDQNHAHNVAGADGAAKVLTHGGIHPRNPANCMCLPGDDGG